jgi:catechol 2,3-dioxygenase-like lactoylglutathione lyase family enzyme
MATVLDHISIPVSNVEQSKRWYAQALAPLGVVLIAEGAGFVKLGIGPVPYLTLRECGMNPPTMHIALRAKTHSAVDDFHAAAVLAGGACNGAPGLRPNYHPAYYGAFVLDPDGHNIEAVKHAPE